MVGTTNDTATVNLASACLFDAENEIKKRLGDRYDFSSAPFNTTTSIPPMITTLAETLAIGYMYENMSRGGTDSYARADRYIKRVMDNLTSLANGDSSLVNSASVAITESEGNFRVLSSSSDYPTTFNEDDPDSWSVSQSKLDDIADDRDTD